MSKREDIMGTDKPVLARPPSIRMPPLENVWRDIAALIGKPGNELLQDLETHMSACLSALPKAPPLFSLLSRNEKTTEYKETEHLFKHLLFLRDRHRTIFMTNRALQEAKQIPLSKITPHPAIQRAVAIVSQLLEAGIYDELARNFTKFQKLLQTNGKLVQEMSQLLLLPKRCQGALTTACDQIKQSVKLDASRLEYHADATLELLNAQIFQINKFFHVVNKTMALCEDDKGTTNDTVPEDLRAHDSVVFVEAVRSLVSAEVTEYATRKVVKLNVQGDTALEGKRSSWQQVVERAPHLKTMKSVAELKAAFSKSGYFDTLFTSAQNGADFTKFARYSLDRIDKYTQSQTKKYGPPSPVTVPETKSRVNDKGGQDFDKYSKMTDAALERRMRIISQATKNMSSPVRRHTALMTTELTKHLERRGSAPLNTPSEGVAQATGKITASLS